MSRQARTGDLDKGREFIRLDISLSRFVLPCSELKNNTKMVHPAPFCLSGQLSAPPAIRFLDTRFSEPFSFAICCPLAQKPLFPPSFSPKTLLLPPSYAPSP